MTRHNVSRPTVRIALAVTLVCALVGGVWLTFTAVQRSERIHVTAYFANTNGLYVGDQVRILGVPVGEIESITPSPNRARVTFWYDAKYTVPAGAGAAILSPGLVSARVIQLTPPYTGGPKMADNATIAQSRTAVPVEYDDLREQLAKLNQTLQPTQTGGVAPAGQLINTAADNLRGQGAQIRDALTKLSEAISAVGDHSGDIGGTVKNLSVLVSALQSSSDVLARLNGNLATVTGYIAQDPKAIGNAVRDLNTALADVQTFVADNRETLGTTVDKLTSLTSAVKTSLPDLKEVLHVGPNALANFANIYRPAAAAIGGSFALANFASPIQFICGAIQAASKLNYQQSAKLCVQYLAPILKNRQYNFAPIGTTFGLGVIPIPLGPLILPIPVPIVGAAARPNEITYSEDWLRPDYRPATPPQAVPQPDGAAPLAAEQTQPGAARSGPPAATPGAVADEPAAQTPAAPSAAGAGS
ncbi:MULTISPECIES: MCE family protein [Mycobacterium]|uniref:Mammalian cell entry protein n=1 Tax=Mycobacterium colombiense TaxID=339268 RepID=A0A1A0VNP6_9MYCO|nr:MULTISPECIES: MCE family protein [Mycobacterium]OBB84849.1 mammalian cell entry protein [Mycobacterium colombiense]OBC00451.1 mammalian cell entry protein [Mycobacterium sp. 852002-40037_SCH5390672]